MLISSVVDVGNTYETKNGFDTETTHKTMNAQVHAVAVRDAGTCAMASKVSDGRVKLIF